MQSRSRIGGGAQRRRALLEAYVAPEVVAHIVSNGAVALLSGVRLPVVVLFADICNFTRLADALPAERVVEILDQYFAAMTAAATAHGAMIDKLVGDAIMLVYGVPAARGDEADSALATAAAMHRAFDHLVDRWRRAVPTRIGVGLAIGIASGDAVLANVGSAARMDYTLIGAPVNRAARLTGAARRGETLVDAAVHAAATMLEHVRFGRARHLRLKGFRRPVAAHAVRFSEAAAVLATPTVIDPICGMKLDRRRALSAVEGGRRFFFCSDRCRAAWRRAPERVRALRR